MNELDVLYDKFVKSSTRDENDRYSVAILEELAYAKLEDITSFIQRQIEEDFYGNLPPYFFLLAHRLVCLQNPDNKELLERALLHVQYFYSDYSNIVKQLEEQILNLSIRDRKESK